MSDLISRSELLKQLTEYENELQKDMEEATVTEDENMLFAIRNQKAAIYIIKRNIANMPTSYDIDNVIKELEKNASRYTKKYVTPYGNNGYKDTKAISVHKAIEIVKQGGVSDNVCEWIKQYKTYDWTPSCETNSVYNVAEVVWFKYCPFCGKKIKVME